MKKFDFYLKILVVLSCLLLSACQNMGKPAELNSPYKVSFDLNNWKLVNTRVSSVGYIQLYEPASQGTVVKERIDVLYGKGEKSTLDEFFQTAAVDVKKKKICESISREVLSKTSNTITYYSKLNNCRTPSLHKEMINIEKGFAQPDGLYIIRYVAFPDTVNPDEIIHMKKVILSSTLVKNTVKTQAGM